jgi:hypothetical protein
LDGCCNTIFLSCPDLIRKPPGEKIRIVLLADETERFILMCSDLTLAAPDIIRVCSYLLKIDVLKLVNFGRKGFSGRFFMKNWEYPRPSTGKEPRWLEP